MCDFDLNLAKIEKRLIDLLNRRVVTYQMQDLKCVNCKMACHKRCYTNVLVDCPKSKALNPEANTGPWVSLKNPHVFRETWINIPKICQVHMQYIWLGKCLMCINCHTYVHSQCR